jgi:hypothetical protein
MQEISGKRVEVKAATPKGSGPVGRGGPGAMGAMGAMPPGRGLGFAYPTRGMVPGRYPGSDAYGWAMTPAGVVGCAVC